jgi:hypothetical protein
LLGATNDPAVDFKLTNDGGIFKVETASDNFVASGSELWRVNASGFLGIGTTVPESRLNIDGGEAATYTDDGYLMLGSKFGVNTIFDPNEILVRNNGNSSSIYIQSHGAPTYIGNGGGDAYFGQYGGKVGIGTTTPAQKLSLHDTGFQLHLRNTENGTRHWYIGASNDNWVAGGNQLLFSPTSSSGDAIFRLVDVSDNNGTDAPLVIQSSASQALLIDGNEIDSKYGPLYVNYNSEQNTYINPSGGSVGIGTDDVTATLHIKSNDANVKCLRLYDGSSEWSINPNTSFHTLQFFHGISLMAHVDGSSGQWVSASDQRLKENILPLYPVLDKINSLQAYRYNFKEEPGENSHIGVIAQELEEKIPEAVMVADDEYTVAYSKLSAVLIKAIQEQQDEIDRLESELNEIIAAQHP